MTPPQTTPAQPVDATHRITTGANDESGVGKRKSYHALNAQLNLFDSSGRIQFDKDIQAAQDYLAHHGTPGMVSR